MGPYLAFHIFWGIFLLIKLNICLVSYKYLIVSASAIA